MTVTEVADYLRVRERTIYELVRTQRIPSCKLSGKLLFPKRLIEQWVADAAAVPGPSALPQPPPVLSGSHDPLLEWAVRESGSELALLVGGSSAGLQRLISGQAVACGVHLADVADGYAGTAAGAELAQRDVVVIEWAKRQQGLVLAKGNPAGIGAISDLKRKSVRVVVRQDGSGSAMLLAKLLDDAGIPSSAIKTAGRPVSSESDIAIAIRSGRADVGLAIEAAAREQGLDFLPLVVERFDLVVRRAQYFDPPMQRLLSFVRTPAFRERAAALGGYDVGETGRVVFNPKR